jgi:predicted ArsR family transcriptional regulator
MIQKDMQARLETKTGEQQFVYILQHEFQFAPKIAQAILDEAEANLRPPVAQGQAGQRRVVLAHRQAGHGRALRETETVTVIWTIDAGEEDRQVWQRHGAKALRQVQVQRLLLEAVEQEAAASQEDLAQALNVSVRTIKRDFEELQGRGIYLPSRGNLHGIGRGQTHKAQIIERWLRGESYDQIALHTHHAIISIQRYLRTFVRVIELHQQDFSDNQIAMLLQIGLALVQEYLAVYHNNDRPDCQLRLQEQLERLGGHAEPKKGAL